MNARKTLPKIDMAGVAQRLEALREAHGIQKGEFADSFGLHPSSYSKVIQSAKPLKSEWAYIISQRWGASMDYIYKGDLSRIEDALRAKIMTNLNKAEP
jgi:plasmid maintenance system antidote protein VapI